MQFQQAAVTKGGTWTETSALITGRREMVIILIKTETSVPDTWEVEERLW